MKYQFVTLIVLAMCLFSASSVLRAQQAEPAVKWRFGASGGIGYSFVSGTDANGGSTVNSEKMDRFNDDARWSRLLTADVHYFISPEFGLGSKYLFNTASAKGSDLIQDIGDGAHYVVGDISETVYINYVGISFSGIYPFGREGRFMLIAAVSGGYAHYRDEATIFMSNYLATAHTFASTYELGVEYFVQPNISLGANLGAFSANFYSIKQTDGQQTATVKLNSSNRLNASNLNISLGIRYYVNK